MNALDEWQGAGTSVIVISISEAAVMGGVTLIEISDRTHQMKIACVIKFGK